MTHYVDLWKRAFDFNGRSTRANYWYAALYNVIISIIIIILSSLASEYLYIVYCLYGLAIVIPYLSLNVRRLHDIGKSWVYLLLGCIPFVGAIIMLVFVCTPSQEFDNEYGPYPYGRQPKDTY